LVVVSKIIFLSYIYGCIMNGYECGSLLPGNGASSGYGWRNGLQYGG